MSWWFHVVESKHDLQNPTSPEKIRSLGECLGLNESHHVLDLGAGRGGPALVLAREFGCRITCVERSGEFLEAARQRAREAGVEDLLEFAQADALEYPIGPSSYDCALCLGASFVWGDLGKTVATLARAVRAGGFVVVGEPYWRRWPLPDGFVVPEDFDFFPLAETVTRFETVGVGFVTLIASSQDDWDRYESLHWLVLEEWLHANPGHEDAERFREMGRASRQEYLEWQRDLLGWAILVGRKR